MIDPDDFTKKTPEERRKFLEEMLVKYAKSVVAYKRANNNFFASLEGKIKPGYYRDQVHSVDANLTNNLENEKNRNHNVFSSLFKAHLGAMPNEEMKEKEVWHFFDACTELLNDKVDCSENDQVQYIFPYSPINSDETKYFVTEGVSMLGVLAANYPMSAQDKYRALDYIVANNYHLRTSSHGIRNIDNTTLAKMVSGNPHNVEQEFFENLYNKTIRNLNEKTKGNSREIAVFFNMFEHFEQKVKVVSDETVNKYADIYFMMSDKSKNELDVGILKRLATKTTRAVTKAQFCGEKEVFDKDAIQGIFASYIDHVNKSGSFNQGLANQMARLAAMSFDSADYTAADIKKLYSMLDVCKVSGRGKAEKEKGLKNLAVMIGNISSNKRYGIYSNPLSAGYNLDQPVEVSHDNKLKYAKNLFSDAKSDVYYDQEVDARGGVVTASEVKVDGLYDVLVQDGKVDKPLLLDVADAYANLYTSREMESGAYNTAFHEKMTRMMQSIVTNFDFTDAEVRDLSSCLAKGAEGTYAVEISSSDRDMEEYGVEKAYTERRGHEVFQNMASSISYAYSPVEDRVDRYSANSKPISPITIFGSKGGKGGNG